MERLLRKCHQIPLGWSAFALGFVILLLTRVMPGADWSLPPSAQARLDEAYIQVLQESPFSYSLLDHEGFSHRQTRGAHVLPQMVRAGLGTVIGDVDRAGTWISFVCVLASLAGVYTLSRHILPLRGYCLITVVAMAGVGSVQFAIRPDPSAAMGMALLMWGFVTFLGSLIREQPYKVFLSGILIGLAGYIRVELSLIWILLALYLIGLNFFPSPAKRHRMPLIGMALGGLLVVVLLIWPMVHLNMKIAGSPILPGPDTEWIFGAPLPEGSTAVSFLGRLFLGYRVLLVDPIGLGMFAGLLWPIGMGISLLTHRHHAVPFFWLPLLFMLMLLVTACGLVTGLDSYLECLQIIAPVLLPFSVLAVVYPFFRWMQQEPRPFLQTRKVWAMAGLAVYLMVQLPHVFRELLDLTSASRLQAKREEQLINLILAQEDITHDVPIVTDLPGVLLEAGWKRDCVLGAGGETDYEIQSYRYANGNLNGRKLAKYLIDRKVHYLHFSSPDGLEELVNDLVQDDSGIVSIQPVSGFQIPLSGYGDTLHQLLEITYADPSGT